MKTVLIILALIAVATGAVVYFIKKGKIKDQDGDYIPDAVEDAAARTVSTKFNPNFDKRNYIRV